MGAPADQWYHAGRDHIFFASEADIHRGRLDALALPSLPPPVRERLTGDRGLSLQSAVLLPEGVVAKSGSGR